MKKIFASILALAAFASCSTAVDNDFVAAGTTFTAPMEISVAESRAFDADLNWSWETTDVIAAYQNAGEKSVNALALNASGNFYNEAFIYATEELSQFHFVYPASQLGADYSLAVAQTGAWTPVLYGTVEAATVANLGTVEMNYLSSAFEVRVWENGRAARKNIVKAVLSSANDFVPTWNVNNDLTYTQTLSGKELSLELNGDTAIFNLGEGDFAFNLVLTDTEGETLIYELPAKNFVAGKRTILNVEWRQTTPAVEGSIDSWYEDYANNGNSALEGGAIYVTAVGGEPVVTVNGETKQVVDGKVAVESGSHNVVVTINGQEVVNRSIVVTSIPTVSATIRTSYSNNGSEAKNNSIDGKALQVTTSLNDSELASYVSTCQVAYGSTFANCTLNGQSNFTVPVGAYNCYVKVALKNGYVCQSQAYTTHVTGIPLSYAFYNNGATDLTAAKNAGWSFSKDNTMSDQLALWNNSEAIVVGSPKFHAPVNINTTTTLGHRLYKAGFTSSTYNAYVGASSSPTSAVKTNTYSIKSTNNTGETASISTHKGNDTNVVVSSSTPYITITADTESSMVVFYHYLHTIKIEYR
ncbi:MAG: hypothetical protein IKA07_01640 [Alistipes sp.]|nr:hypothetical protein [Alistipes sp.]